MMDEHPFELGWMGIIGKDQSVHTVQSPDGIQYDLTKRSHASKDNTLMKLGGKKMGHKSNQIFTSWKYEKEGTSGSNEDDEVEGDIVIELCGGMNCLALGLHGEKRSE